MSPTPILFLSDDPTSGTGLGRITRDLATRVHKHLPDKFRVGTCGYGGNFSRELGFPQYTIKMQDWHVFNLPEIWKDFAGDEHGILMPIWDASRLLWLARPENEEDPRLRNFLQSKPFDLWTYSPMDAHGVGGKLPAILKHTLEGFDRVLAYSKWAYNVLNITLDHPEEVDLDWRPHGIDTSVFYPRDRRVARHGFGEKLGAKTQKGKWVSLPDDAFLIGIVATNQARKDWGLGIHTISEISKLKAPRPVWCWLHIDRLENAWGLAGLIQWDFKIYETTIVTTVDFSDDKMAWAYTACDLTLGIGGFEGFGYPIFESLACGTPCLHGNGGGAPEHMPSCMVIDPFHLRIDGVYSLMRPVHLASQWAERANGLLGVKSGSSLLPAHLDWNNLWPSWEEWFVRGLK
jgi:glycosyltransferase involved in cell wall biosynthesis